MTVLYVRRIGNALFPDGEESICQIAKIPMGKILKAEVKQPRNGAHHRLYFALCNRIADGIGSEADSVSTVFKMATNHVDTIRTKSYGDVKVPRSISFAKMDQTAFREFFDLCVKTAFEQWGLEPQAFADLLDQKTEVRA